MIDRIRLGLFWFRVIVQDEIRDPVTGRVVCAQVNNEKRLVLLQRSHVEGGGDWENSILHEHVHAVDYQAALGLTENQVTVLSCAFEAFMRDNPNFMRGESNGNGIRTGPGGEHQP